MDEVGWFVVNPEFSVHFHHWLPRVNQGFGVSIRHFPIFLNNYQSFGETKIYNFENSEVYSTEISDIFTHSSTLCWVPGAASCVQCSVWLALFFCHFVFLATQLETFGRCEETLSPAHQVGGSEDVRCKVKCIYRCPHRNVSESSGMALEPPSKASRVFQKSVPLDFGAEWAAGHLECESASQLQSDAIQECPQVDLDTRCRTGLTNFQNSNIREATPTRQGFSLDIPGNSGNWTSACGNNHGSQTARCTNRHKQSVVWWVSRHCDLLLDRVDMILSIEIFDGFFMSPSRPENLDGSRVH